MNRDGQSVDLQVTLGSDEDASGASTQQQSESGSSLLDYLYGGTYGQNEGNAA